MGEREEQGFEVAPTRIGGSPGRGRSGRRRLPILLVGALVIAIPTIAWAGPHIVWRPEVDLSFLRPTPTPVPSKTPAPNRPPTPAPPTPLPAVTVGQGAHPTEPFAVDVGGLRMVDPVTGSLGPQMGPRVDNDAIFRSPSGDGWWCVCFARTQTDKADMAIVEVRRVDRSGKETHRHTVGEYTSSAAGTNQDFWTRFDLVISPDNRLGYLSSATRSGDTWTLVVERLDLPSGEVTARETIGTVVTPAITGPTPPPDQGQIENYLAGPFMRLSPDGSRILLWTWMDSSASTGEMRPSSGQAWLIDVDEPAATESVGRLATVGQPLADHLRTCYWMAWTGVDELATMCWSPQASGPTVLLLRLDAAGSELSRHDIPVVMNSWITDPVIDMTSRVMYLWEPSEHRLSRIDLDTSALEVLKVDPAATGGGPAGSSGPPLPGRAHDWATFTSDMRIYYQPQLIAEPGGNRLFALGILADQGYGRSYASSGVWVFDADKLALLDRWSPLAAYTSIGLSEDARWLYAVGQAGTDEKGDQANWQASITVHDVADGRPALLLGRLGRDTQILQVPP